MAFSKGKDCKVTVNAGTSVVGIGSYTISGVVADILETTEMGDDYKTFTPSLLDSGTVTFEGLCDIADSMIEKCTATTGIQPKKWDGKDLPFSDKTFDCVVSVNVMLHVPPESIEHFIAEHFRVSQRFLFVASGYKFNLKLSKHVFDHDYDKLFAGRIVDIISRNDTNKIWILKS